MKNTHGPKFNMQGVFCPQKLQAIQATMAQAGRAVPHESFRGIDWHPNWSGWRVQIPALCGTETLYFSVNNYGGVESALIEAKLYRDACFAKVGLTPYSRMKARSSRKEVNKPYVEVVDRRNGSLHISGRWVVTINGKTRQKVVCRTYGQLRTKQQAIDEVLAHVAEGVAKEERRIQQEFLESQS